MFSFRKATPVKPVNNELETFKKDVETIIDVSKRISTSAEHSSMVNAIERVNKVGFGLIEKDRSVMAEVLQYQDRLQSAACEATIRIVRFMNPTKFEKPEPAAKPEMVTFGKTLSGKPAIQWNPADWDDDE